MRAFLLLPILLAAAPLRAAAGGAITQASGVSSDPANFDGARARAKADLVPAPSSRDRRTTEQVAQDEQAKADARAALAAKAPSRGIEPPRPDERLQSSETAADPSADTLRGLAGLGIGILVGGLIGYGLSRVTA
ncbi:MAG: hypothetical protein HY403_06630 [Elusimicrobia bacterium]|nr:hypothetical protein [Elusimicrobiota bacterium]